MDLQFCRGCGTLGRMPPIQPQTKKKLEHAAALLDEVSSELRNRKPFMAEICSGFAEGLQQAVNTHFHHIEFDLPVWSRFQMRWTDEDGRCPHFHHVGTATIRIEERERPAPGQIGTAQ